MKKKVEIIALCSVILTFISTYAFSAVIYFKSGEKIEGKIIEKTDKYIKVDMGGGVPLTCLLDTIERIDGETVVQKVDDTQAPSAPKMPVTLPQQEVVKPQDYRYFNIFKIRPPSEWQIEEKISDYERSVWFIEPNLNEGFLIMYAPCQNPDNYIFTDEYIKNRKDEAKNVLLETGTVSEASAINVKSSNYKTNTIDGIKFDTEINDIKTITNIAFIKNGYAFEIVFKLSPSNYYNKIFTDIEKSLATFEFTSVPKSRLSIGENLSKDVPKNENPISKKTMHILSISLDILFALLSYRMAKCRRLPFLWAWVIAGFFLTIFVVIILFFIPRRNTASTIV